MLGSRVVKPDPIYCFAPQTIRGHTIRHVTIEAFKDIYWYDNKSITEDGEKIIEVGPRTYVIDHITHDRVVDCLPYTQKFLDEYTNKMINGYGVGTNFEYDYHARLCNYPASYSQCEDQYNTNQIYEMRNKLIKNYNTRRAVAVTWVPDIDNYKKDVPCLQYIQCTIRADALHMNVLFRSNDMLMGFPCNAYALTTLQRNITDYISRSINKKLRYGFYSHTVISPHIYYERDAQEFQAMIENTW